MFKKSEIPLWINILMLVLVALMAIQVFQFYFAHESLIEAGITIGGDPDKNILFTTAGRLAAMAGITSMALYMQKPLVHFAVLFMSVLREGQEMIIDPLFPYANAQASPAVDFAVHVVIVASELCALIIVYKISNREASTKKVEPKAAN